MNTKVAVVLTVVVTFLLWNVIPKYIALVMGMIIFVLLNNKWDELSSIFVAKKGA